MRKRSISVLVRLNEKEHTHLASQVQKSGLSQEAYLRSLISGYVPKPMPPLDYYAMIRQLHAIGNNLNQLAVKAHTTGHLERAAFQQEADQLRFAVQQIQQAVTSPERITKSAKTNPEAHPP